MAKKDIKELKKLSKIYTIGTLLAFIILFAILLNLGVSVWNTLGLMVCLQAIVKSQVLGFAVDMTLTFAGEDKE